MPEPHPWVTLSKDQQSGVFLDTTPQQGLSLGTRFYGSSDQKKTRKNASELSL